MKKGVNRRDFLKSSAAIGTACLGTGAASMASCSGEPDEERPFAYVTPPGERELIQQLENEYLRVQVFSDGVIEVYDKPNRQLWHTYAASIQDETEIAESILWGRQDRSMGEQYPGRFIGKKAGNGLDFQLYGRQNLLTGSFTCKFTLENEWLAFQLLDADEKLPSLVYPPPFESDALVLPLNGGTLLRNDRPGIYSGIYSRKFLSFYDRLSMRFIAGLKGENGWICAYDTGSAEAGAMMVNGQIAPAWLKSLGRWNGLYRAYYGFTGDSYMGIARRYRKFAMNNGLHKSLREKMQENPEVRKLLGGRALQFMQFKSKGYPEVREEYWATERQLEEYRQDHILFSFRDVMEKVRYAEKNLGFSKGMVLLRGWMNGGYDSSHPDIWPVESRLGTEKEIREIMDLRNRYVTALHDNYQDFYPTAPSFPGGVVHRRNGKLMAGGMWFGKQCYLTNSRDSVRYAGRNWEKLKQLGSSGYFVDCTPCNPLVESYEEGNTLTRLQDMQYKHDILKVFYDAGQVVGSESFGDFCVPVMHWSEHRQRRSTGETIPLWQLVFHDAVLGCRYSVFDRRTPYPSWLEDMLYGNFLRFWIPVNMGTGKKLEYGHMMGWGSWKYTEEEFRNSYHVDRWHGKIGLAAMTSHAFLTEDMQVEEAIYDDRYRILVNFGSETARIEGRIMEPYSYTTEG